MTEEIEDKISEKVDLSVRSTVLLNDLIYVLDDIAHENDDSLFNFLAEINEEYDLFNRSLGDIASIIKSNI